jgi:general secretion pathway protein K
MSKREDQRGIALLVVLLLLASVAVVALATTQLMARAVARTGAAQARDQAVWLLLGAEQAALAALEADQTPADTAADPHLAGPVTLPLGGAVVRGSFEDAPCVNVNAFVVQDGEALRSPIEPNPGQEAFGGLVEALGGNRVAGLALAAATADFIDTDDAPNPAGAEDFTYAREAVPRLTAGGFLADVSELRAVAGWDADTYVALKPYLCALPTADPARLNVNMLRPEHAPLLRAALGNEVPIFEAERLIAQAPPDGYEQVGTFLSRLQTPPTAPPLDVSSSLVLFRASVQGGGQGLSMTTTFHRSQGGDWQPIARAFSGSGGGA